MHTTSIAAWRRTLAFSLIATVSLLTFGIGQITAQAQQDESKAARQAWEAEQEAAAIKRGEQPPSKVGAPLVRDSLAAVFNADPSSLGAIPDGTGGTAGSWGAPRNVTFNVAGLTAPISNIVLNLTMDHTFIGDLEVIIAPPGVNPGDAGSFVIFSRVGAASSTGIGDSSDLGGAYSFSNAATTDIWTAAINPACGTACVIPAQAYRTVAAGPTASPAVTDFNAWAAGVTNVNGTWTLRFRDGVSLDTGNVTAASLDITGSTAAQTPKPCFDFFGSGRTSFATARAADNNLFWSLLNNGGNSEQEFVTYGLLTDFITPGYFDADNRADLNVWRPGTTADSQARYFVRPSTAPSTILVVNWGRNDSDPSNPNNDFAGNEGDYDGDGRDDPTIVRPQGTNYVWFYLRSSNNTVGVVPFGDTAIDVLLPGADYTGDGRADVAVVRTGAGTDTYIIGDSNTGAIVLAQPWGEFSTDFYVVGNYLGDSRADFAVWRAFGTSTDGNWYIKENGGTATLVQSWGIPGTAATRDTAVCGDYDGDSRSDIAVYRPSNSTFYWINSASLGGTVTTGAQVWGQPNDFPIGSLKTR